MGDKSNHPQTSSDRNHGSSNLRKVHECEFCSKCFSYKSNLELHLIKHSNERPFRCRMCDKGFKYKCTLNIHERSHRGEKPFKCGRRSVKKEKYDLHCKFHMRQANDPNKSLEQAGPSSAHAHEEMMQTGPSSTENYDQFVCSEKRVIPAGPSSARAHEEMMQTGPSSVQNPSYFHTYCRVWNR
ncbi:zinc finger and BTB domain-containing protein 14-like [Centruroides vittatus]|uniref:zinc finger and BTB domain-containing protein 14-like n=1 Tax=Centruroides vittatus TaxID=120091 RepID=UPI00350F08E9